MKWGWPLMTYYNLSCFIFHILIKFLMSLGLYPSPAGLEAEVKIALELWIISAAIKATNS